MDDDALVMDMTLRAIALVRAAHAGDEACVLAAFDGLDADGVGMVAVQGARITAGLITADGRHTVDEVCRKLERNIRAAS